MPMRLLALLLMVVNGLALTGCAAGYAARGDAVVAADHALASAAGVEMLEQGGNAVDAAVAASFCLSVVRPQSCGIGGGGFMVIHLQGDEDEPPRQIALNYRETTPAAIGPAYYMANEGGRSSTLGGSAVATPGTVAGLLHALETYGTLDRDTVLAPAIRAAEKGFLADEHFLKAAASTAELIEETPDGPQRFQFLYEDLLQGGEVQVGDRITNPRQAEALRLIVQDGRAAFYGGAIGESIVAAVRRDGADLDLADLAGYTVAEMTPLRGDFREFQVLTMPPPSSGGLAILQMLGMLESQEAWLDEAVPGEAVWTHRLTEVMKHAFADRARWLGDPAFGEVPTPGLLDPRYRAGRAARIEPTGTLVAGAYGSHPAPAEDGGTSHISVIDAQGNAVACTETINLHFGSKLAVEEYGFLLNNEMDDFLTVPGKANAFGLRQSRRNLPEPGKRPLSSMSPTIVLREGHPVLVVGGSGGPRIISATVQVLLNVLVHGMDAAEAVAAPRLHHQWQPDLLRLEASFGDAGSRQALAALGHALADYPSPAAVQAVQRRDGRCLGASDPRKGGRPAGYDNVDEGERLNWLQIHFLLGGGY
ncbi:MAG: gamma-glutamyltransferase [Phycisphaerales bacterium JB038]